MRVSGPRFDDSSEDKLWVHRLTTEDVLQLFEESPKAWPQRNGRYRMIGPNRGGTMITAVVEAPDSQGMMYVVTGWPSDKEEIAWYGKPGGMRSG